MRESSFMPPKSNPPEFDAFAAWLARQDAAGASNPPAGRREKLLAAAREARDAALSSELHGETCHIEVLQLLAAADKSDTTRPPELKTARGFRVTLSYDESGVATSPSICVLVNAPPELVGSLAGRTVWLWSGEQRFELGQFDADGKAIGTLPAGIEISLADFAEGKVKLEEPTPQRYE
jgi:hypothetical protein